MISDLVQSPGSSVGSWASILTMHGRAATSAEPLEVRPLDPLHDFWVVCACGARGLIRFDRRARVFRPDWFTLGWVFSWNWKIGDLRGWNCGAPGHASIAPMKPLTNTAEIQRVVGVISAQRPGFFLNELLDDFGTEP